MKKYMMIVLLLLPVLLLSVSNGVLDKPTVSLLENRQLKQMPVFTWGELFAGTYLREYEEYFADTFIFRDHLARLNRRVESLWGMGVEAASIVTHRGANIADVHDGDVPERQRTDAENAKVLKSQSLLIYEGKVMEIHKFSAASSEDYAGVISEFAEAAGDSVQVYSLLAPTQIEFLASERYRSLSSSQDHTIGFVYEHLSDVVTAVDAYRELKDHAEDYIYFNTDHHWTAEGAYHAYVALQLARGEEPVPLESYEVGEAYPFRGYLYALCLDESVGNNPDTVFYYIPTTPHEYYYYPQVGIKANVLELHWVNEDNKYGIFLGGDRPWGVITTDVKNQKRIAVVKDSYGNAFIPFLLPHYEQIFIIDPRQFPHNLGEFVRDRNIDEVLFLNYIKVTEHNGFVDLLRKIVH